MSTGSDSSGPKILIEPYKSVGAQDLIKISYSYCGHLRKRGRKERIFNITRWNRKFIIISQGCVYCYKNEMSDKPLSAFSLAIYQCVQIAEFNNAVHCFEIIHEDVSQPSHVFSCETEERRKTWMEQINEAIVQSHLHSGEKLSADSDEGIVVSKQPSTKKRPTIPLPVTPDFKGPDVGPPATGKRYKAAKSEYDFESTDDEDPYDEVGDRGGHSGVSTSPPPTAAKSRSLPGAQAVFPMMNKPGLPKHRQSLSERHPIPLPGAGPKPIPASKGRSVSSSSSFPLSSPELQEDAEDSMENYINLFPEDEYLLNTCDRIETNNALQGKPDGTFLIRNSSKGGHVLAVQTESGIKNFQLAKQDNGKVSLDKTKYFPCIGAMLCFYNKNLLPKSDYHAKLKWGYLHQS